MQFFCSLLCIFVKSDNFVCAISTVLLSFSEEP